MLSKLLSVRQALYGQDLKDLGARLTGPVLGSPTCFMLYLTHVRQPPVGAA
jgi:hypothetical protein